MRRVFAIVVLTISTWLFASGHASAQSEEIEQALRAYIAEQNITGASLYLELDSDVIDIAMGSTNEAKSNKANTNDRYYIASTGKMMVAAAVLAHVETGQLELDAQIWPILKEVPDIERLQNIKSATLRQLLNHTAGFAEYLDAAFDDASNENPDRRWTSIEALRFAFDMPPAFETGTAFEYTNTNYVLLGLILEQLDGSLETSLQEKVFSPLNLERATVGAYPTDKTLAHGFSHDGEDKSQQAWTSILGDGPVVATAEDVGKFMLGLLRDQKLVGSDMLAQMLEGSEFNPDYGLGMGIDDDDLGTWYGHAGSYGGYEADVRYYPELEGVMVVLFNGNPDEEPAFLDIVAELLS